MSKVFISYARDGSHGERLAVEAQQQLQAAGFSVFRDVTDLKAGESFPHRLEFELENSDVMVLVVSEKVRTSEWVYSEFSMAKEIGIPVVPVLAESIRSPLWLRNLQILDFCGSCDWPQLLGAIGHYVGDPSPLNPLSSETGEGGGREKPAWSRDAGNDKYGRYADLTVEGITQRFRWIEPGTFWMGSMGSENGRLDREIRHQVTLTTGFWLADTACSQALWQVVMDDNPAHFQNDLNNPVEQVSWYDVQEHFLLRLNRMIAGVTARLPTEAEWEYACRAGTTGAFNFMGELSLSKINYNGTWDDNKWGDGALQRTTPAKSYLPNHWGLYQMHGNVWEWCQDAWREKLPAEPVTDPQGVGGDQMGVGRVIRGGSWSNGGKNCRSAYRGGYGAANRLNNLGLRLSLGH
ncbi:MAG: SUMF1/EgtB/PvdO family nonheme iron enzyme [Candidatus Thiothrix moscowensis]|nr:SUMF1/EgtB/PvdO family nonheme iron enzyme [Candidatus Thiothrix moscowensis]